MASLFQPAFLGRAAPRRSGRRGVCRQRRSALPSRARVSSRSARRGSSLVREGDGWRALNAIECNVCLGFFFKLEERHRWHCRSVNGSPRDSASETASLTLTQPPFSPPLHCSPAIKTPYREDGRFDLDRYDALVSLQIEHGVQGLIIGGTTGEGQLMSWDEHIMLIAHTVNQFGRRVLVIGNTGSNSTREAVHASEQVRRSSRAS